MAYDISSDNFLATKKIELSEEFGEGAFVELREPTKKEFLALVSARNGLTMENIDPEIIARYSECFSSMLPDLIVGHGFTAKGTPATYIQVRDAIYKKIVASNKVEGDYITWATAPFQSPSKGK